VQCGEEATPIFVDAVTKMSLQMPRGILMRSESSATNYLQKGTSTSFIREVNPVIKIHLQSELTYKVCGITKYNSIPLVRR
jgi:hypothetical protein